MILLRSRLFTEEYTRGNVTGSLRKKQNRITNSNLAAGNQVNGYANLHNYGSGATRDYNTTDRTESEIKKIREGRERLKSPTPLTENQQKFQALKQRNDQLISKVNVLQETKSPLKAKNMAKNMGGEWLSALKKVRFR